MQHRNALLTTLRATRLNPTLHVVNKPFVDAVGALGQAFLQQELGYSKEVAKHTVRAATNAALAIGRPDILLLGLFAEETVTSPTDGGVAFRGTCSSFAQFVRNSRQFDERTLNWTITALAGLNPHRLGGLIAADRLPIIKGAVNFAQRSATYANIIKLGTLEPILRLMILADVGANVLANHDSMVRAYKSAELSTDIPSRYALPIGAFYLPIAEKNGMYPQVDALCNLLGYGNDPKQYFGLRTMIEDEFSRDLELLNNMLKSALQDSNVGLMKDARKVGNFRDENVQIGLKRAGRIIYKLEFDPDINLPTNTNREFVTKHIKDMVRGRIIIGNGGDAKKALEKVCSHLKTQGFEVAGEIVRRKSDCGDDVFYKVNLFSPPVNGGKHQYFIELQSVPESIVADLEDGEGDHALMQATKLLKSYSPGANDSMLLNREIMRGEAARYLLRQVAAERLRSKGNDRLPDLRLVEICSGGLKTQITIYAGATVADALSQVISIATPGLVAQIDGARVPFRSIVPDHATRIEYTILTNGDNTASYHAGMGHERAMVIMAEAVMPETATQLAQSMLETFYKKFKGDGNGKKTN